MKTSKITKLTGNGTWQSNHGLLYKHLIEFENGDSGEVNTKTEEPPYKVGEEVSYKITPSGNQYPDRIKIEQESKGSGSKNNLFGDKRGFALSYAKDLAVARIRQGQREHTDTSSIIAQADKFYEWLNK